MEIKSYRARSVQEALALVRADLGPDAAVLHTREVAAGGKWFGGARQIEVIATPEAENVPSRVPPVLAEPLPLPTPEVAPLSDRYRSRLASIAAQGFDLLDAEPPPPAAPLAEPQAHSPQEVAAQFWQFLQTLPAAERREVVSAFAATARAGQALPGPTKSEL